MFSLDSQCGRDAPCRSLRGGATPVAPVPRRTRDERPRPSRAFDVPFSFVVEFLDAEGVVIERFAQGTGLISVDLGF